MHLFNLFRLKPYRDTQERLWVTERQLKWHFCEVLWLADKEPVFISRDTPGSDLVLMSIEHDEKLKLDKVVLDRLVEEFGNKEPTEATGE